MNAAAAAPLSLSVYASVIYSAQPPCLACVSRPSPVSATGVLRLAENGGGKDGAGVRHSRRPTSFLGRREKRRCAANVSCFCGGGGRCRTARTFRVFFSVLGTWSWAPHVALLFAPPLSSARASDSSPSHATHSSRDPALLLCFAFSSLVGARGKGCSSLRSCWLTCRLT